jgi:hypothetical protein
MWQAPRNIDAWEVTYGRPLRRKAAHYRELARHITDIPTQSGLIRLAGRYEAEAKATELGASKEAINGLDSKKNG